MKKFYRITYVPESHVRELGLAAAGSRIPRAEAFERLVRAGDPRSLILDAAASYVHDPDGETITMAIDAGVKAAVDRASASTGVPIQTAGRLILAAHAGRMVEALRDGAA